MTTTFDDAVQASCELWFDEDYDIFVCLIKWPNGDYHELRVYRDEVTNQWDHYPHEE